MVKALHLYWLTFNEGPEPVGNVGLCGSKSEVGCNHE
jgi:hypothetical protein